MRHALIALSILFGAATPAMAQVGVTVAIPGVSIGIHQPAYPDLVLVPGYPVYYAPHAPTNYFFYDGFYWVYQDDRWYMSSWYDGPWDLVEPDDVPLFVLRVPVRYYVAPPVYFHGWAVMSAPLWHVHWGPRWTRYHQGWDRWDRRVVYAPAPLPVYQRNYHGDRYPRRESQRVIRHEHYHYQPRDQVVRRHEQRPAPRPQAQVQRAPQNPPVRYGPYSRDEQGPQREREEPRRSEAMQVLPAQRAPVAQEQPRPQPRQEPERRAEPQDRPAQQREQREHRERGEARRPEGMQVLPQQRAAVLQERQQQQQQFRQQQQERQQPQRQEAPRAQQAPRPQQAQDRGQPRGNAERQQRGGERGPGRG